MASKSTSNLMIIIFIIVSSYSLSRICMTFISFFVLLIISITLVKQEDRLYDHRRKVRNKMVYFLALPLLVICNLCIADILLIVLTLLMLVLFFILFSHIFGFVGSGEANMLLKGRLEKLCCTSSFTKIVL